MKDTLVNITDSSYATPSRFTCGENDQQNVLVFLLIDVFCWCHLVGWEEPSAWWLWRLISSLVPSTDQSWSWFFKLMVINEWLRSLIMTLCNVWSLMMFHVMMIAENNQFIRPRGDTENELWGLNWQIGCVCIVNRKHQVSQWEPRAMLGLIVKNYETLSVPLGVQHRYYFLI